ncbi:MAG: DUF779 domain-containing protein [Bernardetiaceae bacterium]|nr:DUF779 domain-containing protein [Bernardetiaceae bacterium]
MATTKRIDTTEEARKVISELKAIHGDLMFHQSGGCCDGSSPMCYAKDDFKIGDSDIWLGEIENCDFYMSSDQFEYWKHTHLTIDVTPGRGSSFSIEIPMGIRFLIRSRVFTEQEMEQLSPIRRGAGVVE